MEVRVLLERRVEVDAAVGQRRRRPQLEVAAGEVEQDGRRGLRLVAAGEGEDLVVEGDAVLARREEGGVLLNAAAGGGEVAPRRERQVMEERLSGGGRVPADVPEELPDAEPAAAQRFNEHRRGANAFPRAPGAAANGRRRYRRAGHAAAAFDAIAELITGELKKGHPVVITGFGTFKVGKRAARTGVNPRNPSEKIKIPAMKVAAFKAGKALKKRSAKPLPRMRRQGCCCLRQRSLFAVRPGPPSLKRGASGRPLTPDAVPQSERAPPAGILASSGNRLPAAHKWLLKGGPGRAGTFSRAAARGAPAAFLAPARAACCGPLIWPRQWWYASPGRSGREGRRRGCPEAANGEDRNGQARPPVPLYRLLHRSWSLPGRRQRTGESPGR